MWHLGVQDVAPSSVSEALIDMRVTHLHCRSKWGWR